MPDMFLVNTLIIVSLVQSHRVFWNLKHYACTQVVKSFKSPFFLTKSVPEVITCSNHNLQHYFFSISLTSLHSGWQQPVPLLTLLKYISMTLALYFNLPSLKEQAGLTLFIHCHNWYVISRKYESRKEHTVHLIKWVVSKLRGHLVCTTYNWRRPELQCPKGYGYND